MLEEGMSDQREGKHHFIEFANLITRTKQKKPNSSITPPTPPTKRPRCPQFAGHPVGPRTHTCQMTGHFGIGRKNRSDRIHGGSHNWSDCDGSVGP
jgi:hypothetical protein